MFVFEKIHLHTNFWYMKIKTNAVAIYMQSEEVKKSITSKNLDLKDMVEEKILFLESVEGKDVILKGHDNWIIKIARYENWKSYEFYWDICDFDEDEDEEDEKKENLLNGKNIKMFVIWILFLIFLIVWVIYIKINNEKVYAEEINKVSEFEIRYDQINKINIEIAQELENQNEMRKMKEEIDKKINESIQKVHEKEKKQNELRLESINLSNKL